MIRGPDSDSNDSARWQHEYMHISGIAIVRAATVAQVASQVPFWLQVFTVALSPVLGFVGVGVGAFIAELNRRDAYVKDERRKVYRDYLEIVSQITNYYSTEYLFAMSHAKEGDLRGTADKVSSLQERLLSSYLHVRLIGSPAAINAASHAFAFTASAGTLTAVTLASGFNRNDWDPVIKVGLEAQSRFTEAARKDLGLPRKEIALPPTGDLEAPNEEQKFIRDVLHRMRGKDRTGQGLGWPS